MTQDIVLAIDQGTTGTTALVLDAKGAVRGRGYAELPQHFPKPGWVEHDGEEIWVSVLIATRRALRASRTRADRVRAIGITNQRETVLVWDRDSGRPLARAIVWQDRRTAAHCDALRRRGLEPEIRRRTGLVLDPYFSGTKLAWLLEHVPGLATRARRGRAVFGTVDSWLLWRLTAGRVHATDPTNASRTMLYDIVHRRWDPWLLARFGVPAAMLPVVRPSSAEFGRTHGVPGIPGGIPITGIAGDQQAALFGQGCVAAGQSKNTYGTGCFLLTHTGATPVRSRAGLLTTVACGPHGEIAYALEGSVFIAGAAMQWLRDGPRLIARAADSEALARSVSDTGGVVMVPAFVGLGAPHWRADARGAVFGLTRGTGRAELVRAALESIAFQTRDVVEAMARDAGRRVKVLRVDGGAAANDWLMQYQADLLGVPVERPRVLETTAFGAALLAGMGAGLWAPGHGLTRARHIERVFRPRRPRAWRTAECARWDRAVKALLAMERA
ncbi:MAG: glycerol kinase GlpK [Candidatus Eisenbacteria bacterium]